MAKFNTPTTRPLVRSPILTNGMLAPTFEGGTGYVRDAKSELFMTAIATMAGEDTFYESGKDRLDRITALVQQVVKEDPAWLQEFLPWLRGPEGNLRSVSISMAVEYAKAGGPNARSVVASVLQRADEPGEAIAYLHSRYGRKLAGGLQRGIADAASRLFNEYCVTPDTLVLRDDLVWAEAGSLLPDDRLVGFDENVSVGRGVGARLLPTVVEHLGRKSLECVKVSTDRGEITVSMGHGFVGYTSNRNRVWRDARDVRVGDRLLWACEPWAQVDSREAGYLAGLFDGEGWLMGQAPRKGLAFAQNPGAVLERGISALKELNFEVKVRPQAASDVMEVRVAGGKWETLRALGQIRPERLIARSDEAWVGANFASKGPHAAMSGGVATVLAIEPLGEREVVTMQTSTRTFIANGFASHNSAQKYDGQGANAVRLGDVIELTHPKAKDARQHALFQYLLDRRHHSTALRVDLAAIPQINEARRLEATPVEERRALLESDPGVLQRAGKTWEWLSGWLPGGMDKQAWEAILGEDTQGLGYMALIRNLRNFSQAGISDAFVAKITQRIQDPAEVAKSRQFPFRFLSAYENSPIEYAPALEKALTLSTQNIPDLSGSLILIDTSSSMRQFYSGRGSRSPLDIAAVMAMATLARSKDSDVVIFGDGSERVDLKPTLGILRGVEKVREMVGRVGHSTYGWTAAKMHYNPVKHKRVIIFTDGQMHDHDPGVNVIDNVYLFMIGGYRVTPTAVGQGGRFEAGGFTDATFKMIDLVERGRDGHWPFEVV